ncbi:DUF4129 domain-containing protein [Spongiimicrobium salis]|uniref:DUF4129 domain-containing protein n=1 Tax=Spongiimicrobium salis TaxID=1667022 RepID=UPI00374C8F94
MAWANIPQDSTGVRYDDAPITLQEINEEDLSAYRDDPKFDYEPVQHEDSLWNDIKNWFLNLLAEFFQWLFGVEEAAGALAIFLRIIPYVLLGLLIYLLIRFFIKANSRAMLHSQKNQSVVGMSEEENIIKNENIHELIKNAIAAGDYRLAIRYYYLSILKLMSHKEYIAWEMQKTNDDYIKELKETDFKQSFARITHLYDYIWYGSFAIDESKFRKAEIAFSELQKAIDNHG